LGPSAFLVLCLLVGTLFMAGPAVAMPTNPVATNRVATNPVATNRVATNRVATNPVATNPVAAAAAADCGTMTAPGVSADQPGIGREPAHLFAG
jgi:hypothetical protein